MNYKEFFETHKEKNEISVLPDFRKSVFNIPHTILNFFGFKSSKALQHYKDAGGDRLIFILIDALGVNLWEKYISDKLGDFSVLSSLFPSTTANVLTTICTGLTPKGHGILEFRMYYEEYGGVIKTLPFTTVDSQKNDLLAEMGYSPRKLFHLPTIFQKLKKMGVSSVSLIRDDYADTLYIRYMMEGSQIVPYNNLEDAFLKLRKRKEDFIYLYLDYLDIVEHIYGVQSSETKEILMRIFKEIELMWKESYTTMLITADHGQIDTERVKIIPWDCRYPPAGSPRDLFVYNCEPPKDEDVDIWSKAYILNSGVLGEGKEHMNLRARLPDYILLPHGNLGIWGKKFRTIGIHGGLSPEEMLVPLLLLEKS